MVLVEPSESLANKESSALIVSDMSIQVVRSALLVGRPVC
jgi:hypothetical protein